MPSIPYSKFRDEVLSLYQTGRHARKTYLHMSQVLRDLRNLTEIQTTADLTTKTMARFVEKLGPSANANTVNGHLDYLRTACSYACEEGWLERPPAWRRLKLRPRKMSLNPPCTVDEVTRLLKHLRRQRGSWEGRRLYCLVSLIVFTGIRRNEAIYARRADLDLSSRTLQIVPWDERLKTFGSERPVPLPNALAEVLEPWVRELDTPWLFPGVKKKGPWSGGSNGSRAIDQLQAAASAVGIARVTWHGLRHTFGSQALHRFNVPLWVVSAILGHGDVRTTQRYLHLDDGRILVPHVRAIAYPPRHR